MSSSGTSGVGWTAVDKMRCNTMVREMEGKAVVQLRWHPRHGPEVLLSLIKDQIAGSGSSHRVRYETHET